MADEKISALSALASVADGDQLVVVDVSDTTSAATGTTKYVTRPVLLASSSFGGIYISASAATTVSLVDTAYKAAGTTTLDTGVTAVDFDMPADNRLRYTGTVTRTFKVEVSAAFSSAGNNELIAIYVAKGGTVIAASHVHHKLGSANDVSATSTHAIVSLATNEYVELYVENHTAASNLTVSNMYMSAVGMY